MKIEVGKRYLRADGGITTKIGMKENGSISGWDFDDKNLTTYLFIDGSTDNDGNTYSEEGLIYEGCTTPMDLIAEVPEHLLEKFIKDILEYYKEEPEENHYLLF